MSGRGSKEKEVSMKGQTKSNTDRKSIWVEIVEQGVSVPSTTNVSGAQLLVGSASPLDMLPKLEKRPDRRAYALTRTEEDTLLTWLQSPDYCIIWDMKKEEYKNREKKEELWEEISLQLGKSVHHLRGWWKSNRDAYTRLHQRRKGKSGDGEPEDDNLNEREIWLLESLSFLQQQIRHRPKYKKRTKPSGNLTVKDIEELKSAISSDIPVGPPPPSKVRRRSPREELRTCVHRMDELQYELAASSRPSPKVNFANYVKGEILNYTDEQFLWAKPRFLALLEELDSSFTAVPILCTSQD